MKKKEEKEGRKKNASEKTNYFLKEISVCQPLTQIWSMYFILPALCPHEKLQQRAACVAWQSSEEKQRQEKKRAYFGTNFLTSFSVSCIFYLANLQNEAVLSSCSFWGSVEKRREVAKLVGHLGCASEVLLSHFTILHSN